jgi:hypothetical protein
MQRLVYHRMVVRDCQRRHRQRQRKGARCLRIVISSAEQTLSAFVRIGVLAEGQDDRAIEAAIAQLCRAGFRAIEARQKASA